MKNSLLNIALASAMLLAFAACQKDLDTLPASEENTAPETSLPDAAAADRTTYYFGVTQYMNSYPSQFIRFFTNGAMQSNDWVQGQDSNGAWSLVKNMVGICEVTGMGAANGHYITTGTTGNALYFQKKLLKIDPNTSSVMVLGTPVYATPGTMKDICFIGTGNTGIAAGIYGLIGSSLRRINASSGFTTQSTIGTLTGLATGFTPKGMSWTTGCGGAKELVVTATRGGFNVVKAYKCNPNTAALTFICDITPTAPEVFTNANCGIGWFAPANSLWVNGKNTTNSQAVYKYGQAAVSPWVNTCSLPLPATPAIGLPVSFRNIEDFCSVL